MAAMAQAPRSGGISTTRSPPGRGRVETHPLPAQTACAAPLSFCFFPSLSSSCSPSTRLARVTIRGSDVSILARGFLLPGLIHQLIGRQGQVARPAMPQDDHGNTLDRAMLPAAARLGDLGARDAWRLRPGSEIRLRRLPVRIGAVPVLGGLFRPERRHAQIDTPIRCNAKMDLATIQKAGLDLEKALIDHGKLARFFELQDLAGETWSAPLHWPQAASWSASEAAIRTAAARAGCWWAR
ncbi:hypothetical protein GOX2533 (plasmid) [Gluconobacter oxydans 621H]|uniref:Uncharacterized protein n=1 Tax=Gluconobacter oxydans (strain 621H) TaxID=290633 RepID=Q5HY04_GLUOX|nr:hypothetical protein GOX2533 [Gluconobacter oxydans 621H]